MAYKEKYRFTFESVYGKRTMISISQDGYTGSRIDRALGGAPVIKQKNNGNIRGTSLEFLAECQVDQEFASLYTCSPYEYRVDILRQGVPVWRGFVEPELYSEPDVAPPYDVSIIATDGLGELKQHTFEAQGPDTITNILSYILGFTGNPANIRYISAITGTTENSVSVTAAQIFGTATINLDYKAGASCYDVLQYILDTFHATITLYQNMWVICRENDLQMSGSTITRIGGTITDAVKAVGAMGTSYGTLGAKLWPVGNLSTKVDAAKNQVSILAPYHKGTPIVNAEMSSDYGWTKSEDAAYDAVAQAYNLRSTGQGGRQWIKQVLASIDMADGVQLVTTRAGQRSIEERSGEFGRLNFTPTGSSDVFHLCDKNDGTGLQWYLDSEVMESSSRVAEYSYNLWLTIGAAGSPVENTVALPAFDRTGYATTGELEIYLDTALVPDSGHGSGNWAGDYVYNCYLYWAPSKGMRNVLNIDNDARGSASEVEVAIGYEVSALSSRKDFFQGLLLFNGNLITSFSARHNFNNLDYLALISRDYALSVALPRLIISGKIDTGNVSIPLPFVLLKDSIYYLLNTYTWDLLNEDLDIEAISLPGVALTVTNEYLVDTTGEPSSSSGAGGGASASMAAQINALQQESLIGEDEDHNAYVKPYGETAREFKNAGGIHARDLILARSTSPSGTADLEVITYTDENDVVHEYLHTRLPFASDQDIAAGGRGNGGGGGGGTTVAWGNDAANGYETLVVEGYTGNQRRVALYGHSHAIADIFTGLSGTPDTGDTLVYGSGGWSYASGGGVTSVIGLTGTITQAQLSTALGLGAAAYRGVADTVSYHGAGLVTAGMLYDEVDSINDSISTLSASIPTALGDLNQTTTGNGSWHFTTAYKNLLDSLEDFSSMFELLGSGTSADPYRIHALYSLYSDGYLSAGGVGSGGGGGGGAMYLGQLEDVSLGTPTYRQVLWRSNTGVWTNHMLEVSDIDGLSTQLNGFVTLSSPQTINGTKTFAATILGSGVPNIGSNTAPFGDLYLKGTGKIALSDGGGTHKAILQANGYASGTILLGFDTKTTHNINIYGTGLSVYRNINNVEKLILGANSYEVYNNAGLNLGTATYPWNNAYIKRWYPVQGNNSIYVEYNAEYGAFYFKGNVVASGYIAAGGRGPSET